MLNKINVMGRLVANPELRATTNGVKVTSFRIACDRDYAAENQQRGVDFFDCVAWRGTGEFVARNFGKGQPILVTGRLQTRDWTDREGVKRRSFEIVADNVYFCGGDKKTKPATDQNAAFEELDGDDDCPFTMGEDDELPL